MTPAPLPAYERIMLAGFALWCVFLGLYLLAAWRSWREPGAWRTERPRDRFCGLDGARKAETRVDGGSGRTGQSATSGGHASGYAPDPAAVQRWAEILGESFRASQTSADAAPREAA